MQRNTHKSDFCTKCKKQTPGVEKISQVYYNKTEETAPPRTAVLLRGRENFRVQMLENAAHFLYPPQALEQVRAAVRELVQAAQKTDGSGL